MIWNLRSFFATIKWPLEISKFDGTWKWYFVSFFANTRCAWLRNSAVERPEQRCSKRTVYLFIVHNPPDLLNSKRSMAISYSGKGMQVRVQQMKIELWGNWDEMIPMFWKMFIAAGNKRTDRMYSFVRFSILQWATGSGAKSSCFFRLLFPIEVVTLFFCRSLSWYLSWTYSEDQK